LKNGQVISVDGFDDADMSGLTVADAIRAEQVDEYEAARSGVGGNSSITCRVGVERRRAVPVAEPRDLRLPADVAAELGTKEPPSA
jgi:hypothetical protein